MKISYHDYSDLYYHGIVKICWKCSKSTDTLTEIISPSFILKTTNKISVFVCIIYINTTDSDSESPTTDINTEDYNLFIFYN